MIKKNEYFYDKKINYLIILSFFILAQIPTFELAIRGDLETYIQISNEYLKGNFSNLFETKPPALYIIYALILLVAEKNLFLFNLFGSFIVLIGSIILYECCDNKNKIFAPIIYIFSSTYLVIGGIHLTTEHIVIIPILIAYYLLKNIKKNDYKKFILVGFLLTLAILIRQNIALLYIGVFIYLLFNYKKYNLNNYIHFIIGSLIVFISLILILITIDELNFFIKTSLSPLHLPAKENLFLNFYTIILFGLHILNFDIGNFSNNINIFNSFSLYFISFFIFINILYKREKILLITFILSISISIFFSRLPNTHYLIQIIPFLSIIINDFNFRTNNYRYKFLLYLNLIFILIVISNLYLNKNFRNEIGFVKNQIQLKEWIIENVNVDDNIYLFRGNLLYYQIPQKSLTFFAHPNTIFKVDLLKYIFNDEFHDTKKEWKNIKKQKPKFIVTYKNDNLENLFIKLGEEKNIKSLVNSDDSVILGIYRITPLHSIF